MNKKPHSIIILLIALAGFGSCDNDDNQPTRLYSNGVFVINEGNFTTGNGDITFYQPDTKFVDDAIYKKANGNFAGKGLQSLTLHNNKIYLVLNGDNKIEVVNTTDFKNEKTITDNAIVNPRYMTIINGKGYLSVWGPYDEFFSLVDSYILVIDMESNAVVKTIDVDEGVERMLYNGQYLFATNFNYGASSTLAVIDPTNNTLIDQIELGPGPNGIILDDNDKLWVIGTGSYGGNDGVLYRINPSTLEIEDSFPLGVNPDGDLIVSSHQRTLFYSAGNSIYKMSIEDDAAPAEPFITENGAVNFYGIGFDTENEIIYAGDDQGFTSVGVVYRYDVNGNRLDTFSCGIAPNGFVFN